MSQNRTIPRQFKWPYTTKETFEILVSTANLILYEQGKGKSFILDEANKKPIRHICHFFSGDVNDPASLGKGLSLLGDVGTGKTFLMEVFKEMFLLVDKILTIIPAIRIYEAYDQNNIEEIRRFETGILCIDDLGSEETILNNWGTKKHPVYQVISKRYIDKRLTFITTNLDPTQIEERYGQRIRDRLKEMCVFIPVTGKSRRK